MPPAGSPVTYKYAIVAQHGQLELEAGENRLICSPGDSSAPQLLCQEDGYFRHALQNCRNNLTQSPEKFKFAVNSFSWSWRQTRSGSSAAQGQQCSPSAVSRGRLLQACPIILTLS